MAKKKSKHCRRWRCRRPGCSCNCIACAKLKAEELRKLNDSVDASVIRLAQDVAMRQPPFANY